MRNRQANLAEYLRLEINFFNPINLSKFARRGLTGSCRRFIFQSSVRQKSSTDGPRIRVAIPDVPMAIAIILGAFPAPALK